MIRYGETSNNETNKETIDIVRDFLGSWSVLYETQS